MGDDFFPARPGLRVDIERGIQLNASSLRNGVDIVGDTVGVRRRAGDEATAGIGSGEEEGMVDVALRDLFGSDHAAKGRVAGGDAATAVLALGAIRAPAGRVGQVATARGPRRCREPHVDLGVGARGDHDQVVVRARSRLGVAGNMRADRRPAVVQGAGDGEQGRDRVRIGDRLAPIIRRGEVGAPRVGGQGSGHHACRVRIDRRAARDGRVPEARCAVQARERSGLRRRRQAGGLIRDHRTGSIQQLDLVAIGRGLPEQVVGVREGRAPRDSDVVDEASTAQDLDAGRGRRQGPEDLR